MAQIEELRKTHGQGRLSISWIQWLIQQDTRACWCYCNDRKGTPFKSRPGDSRFCIPQLLQESTGKIPLASATSSENLTYSAIKRIS